MESSRLTWQPWCQNNSDMTEPCLARCQRTEKHPPTDLLALRLSSTKARRAFRTSLGWTRSMESLCTESASPSLPVRMRISSSSSSPCHTQHPCHKHSSQCHSQQPSHKHPPNVTHNIPVTNTPPSVTHNSLVTNTLPMSHTTSLSQTLPPVSLTTA